MGLHSRTLLRCLAFAQGEQTLLHPDNLWRIKQARTVPVQSVYIGTKAKLSHSTHQQIARRNRSLSTVSFCLESQDRLNEGRRQCANSQARWS